MSPVNGPSGNFYDKYNTKNPIERMLMRNFFQRVGQLFKLSGVEDGTPILEAGCGEGHFTAYIRESFPGSPINAFDISDDIVKVACSSGLDNVDFHTGDIYHIEANTSSYRLICVSEVLEHIEKPAEALKELERVSGKYILVTVPNEPIWRILNMVRGAYLKDFGNTPGHIQHWNKRQFIRMIRENTKLRIVRFQKALPWLQMLLEVTE
ncbi:MAG: methyltransferase domain-containing protein [Lachnospiraceae bacterium]|nr:methyltransferase domain-containing protein [Lachnospiraceae bacterium]